MGRPSLKKERFEQILDAFELCVARYGLAGATLEQLAEQAGLARPLIRHHVGNRDDLVKALIRRFQSNSKSYMQQLATSLPEENRLSIFIDRLFDEKYHDKKLVLVTEALIAASADQPKLAKQLKATIESIVEVIVNELEREFIKASDKNRKIVATGILGIYFNVDSLAMLGNMENLRSDSKDAAIRLIKTLAD